MQIKDTFIWLLYKKFMLVRGPAKRLVKELLRVSVCLFISLSIPLKNSSALCRFYWT